MTGGGDGDPILGQVMRSADTPRFYIIGTPGLVRRSGYQYWKGKMAKRPNTIHPKRLNKTSFLLLLGIL